MVSSEQIIRRALSVVDNSFERDIINKSHQSTKNEVDRGLDKALAGKSKGTDAYLDAINSNNLGTSSVGPASGDGAVVPFKNDQVDLENLKTKESIETLSGSLSVISRLPVDSKKIMREDAIRGNFRGSEENSASSGEALHGFYALAEEPFLAPEDD